MYFRFYCVLYYGYSCDGLVALCQKKHFVLLFIPSCNFNNFTGIGLYTAVKRSLNISPYHRIRRKYMSLRYFVVYCCTGNDLVERWTRQTYGIQQLSCHKQVTIADFIHFDSEFDISSQILTRRPAPSTSDLTSFLYEESVFICNVFFLCCHRCIHVQSVSLWIFFSVANIKKLPVNQMKITSLSDCFETAVLLLSVFSSCLIQTKIVENATWS